MADKRSWKPAQDVPTAPGEQLIEVCQVDAFEDWLPTRAKTHRILVVTPLYTPGCYTPNGYLVISESKVVSGFRYMGGSSGTSYGAIPITVAGGGAGANPSGSTVAKGGRGGKPTLYYVHHPGTNKYLKLRVDTVEGTDIFQWVDGIEDATPFTDYYEAARMSSDSKIPNARVETR